MRRLWTIIALALITLTWVMPVSAHDEEAEDGGGIGIGIDIGIDLGLGGKDKTEPRFAASYINPDLGAATENPDVKTSSDCSRPDRKDRQMLSTVGTTDRNVHNDACLLDRRGNVVDAPISWETYGVGAIFACPDPDGAGPKVAVLTGNRCYQSGFQATGKAGDGEFHIRLNNTDTVGRQDVAFCYDPENNGCADARVVDDIRIDWVA